MPTHLHTGSPSAATIPITSVPNGLTRKQPLFMRSGPLPLHPLQALEIDLEDQPKPDLFPCPQQPGTSTENYKHKGSLYASTNRQKATKPLYTATSSDEP